MTLLLFIFICFIIQTYSFRNNNQKINNIQKRVILPSGLNEWNHSQLIDQYYVYKAYKDLGIIDSSSILAYNLDINGNLATYSTNNSDWTAEEYQASLKNDLKLAAYPCLFCDATIGMCPNLGTRLENLYSHQAHFINDTIYRAKKYGWNGYMVDFEPDEEINVTKLTDLIIEWSKILNINRLTLFVWIGGPTIYELDRFKEESESLILITMSSYWLDYEQYTYLVDYSSTSINDISRFGYGLITYLHINEKKYIRQNKDNMTDELIKIIDWSNDINIPTLVLWASKIPSSLWKSLIRYVKIS